MQRLVNVMARSERGQEDGGGKEDRGEQGNPPGLAEGDARSAGVGGNGA